MIILKTILKWLTIILIVFIIQTLTFLTIGTNQLKGKLLPERLIENKFYYDSVFVRDSYTTDCTSGDFYVFNHPLDLKNYSNQLKEKLGVKFIYFADKASSNFEDPTPDRYSFVYEVNARSGDWSSLFGFYDCKVDEFFCIKKGTHFSRIQRETKYRWYLFFWIQTYEYCDSW